MPFGKQMNIKTPVVEIHEKEYQSICVCVVMNIIFSIFSRVVFIKL